MRNGLVWSHVLASILGGLVVAGVLLAFGVIGKQRTETVPINYSSPPADASGSGSGSSTEQIFQMEAPGVVHIRAEVRRRVTSPFIRGAETAGSTTIGSGFLISRSGLILTTCHQIEGANAITVEFNSDTSRQAEVMDCVPSDDVALLKVNMRGVSNQINSLTLGNSRSVSVGQNVLSIADPFGLDRTLSSGIVSAQQGQLTSADGTGIADVLQTDLPSSPGTDGGPLMDTDGNVIGINSEIEVQSGGRTYPVSFAIPIDTARSVVPKGVLP